MCERERERESVGVCESVCMCLCMRVRPLASIGEVNGPAAGFPKSGICAGGFRMTSGQSDALSRGMGMVPGNFISHSVSIEWF